ncbi:MAG: hypothetical protein RR063_09440 [Anaerovoracaceae bacterium]
MITLITIIPTVYSKDYVWECTHKTNKYLSRELNASRSNKKTDQEIAQAFLEHYNQATLKHKILINNDGEILHDNDCVSIDKVISLIKAMETAGEQQIVIYISATYKKKSEKVLKKLMKSVYELIEYRENQGIPYDSYPVLCSDASIVNELWLMSKTSTSLDTIIAIVEDEEPRISTKSQPAESHTASNSVEPKVSKNKKIGKTVAQDSKVSAVEALGEYSVNSHSSLDIMTTPSTKGESIGNLNNGQHINVIEITNGWAKIWYMDQAYYVKAENLVKVESINDNVDDYSLGYTHEVHRFLYEYMPYVILFLAFLILVLPGSCFMTLSFLLGLSELLFAASNSILSIGVMPWFCEPNKVGWIMTIINFILLCGVLILQHSAYKSVIGDFRLGCFASILSYPLMALVGVALCSCLIDISYFWVPIVALAILWLIIKWKFKLNNIGALKSSLWISVAFGGFFAFFLQTAGVILLGWIIWTLIQGFAASKNTSNSSEESDNNHSQGRIEYAGDGTPYIVHNDGSTTRINDDSGNTMHDSSGNTWHKNCHGTHANR